MTRWVETPLGEVITLKRGYDLPKRLRREGSIPIVSSSGPTGFHSEAKAGPPGVVTGRYGTLGKVFYVNVPFWPLNTTLYVWDFKANCERFVAYFLESMQLERYDGAAAVPGIDRNVLHRVPVRWPPLDIQRRIAAVLAAYDELMENNLRRIEILEEMAQAVYREWFVNFRYPGHENIPLVDSPLGPIPKGWGIRKVGQVADYVSRGVSPKYDDESDAVVINQKCIRNHRLSLGSSRRHATTVRPEKVVRFGDVLINSTGVGTLGRVAQVRRSLENVTVDSHVTIVRPPPTIRAEYWGRALIAEESRFQSLGAGATGQTELRKSMVVEVELLIPTREVVDACSDVIRPMDELAENLADQNANLRATRGLLLPKLVSGEIDVSDLDIDTEWLVS